jgi:hypothetical protein
VIWVAVAVALTIGVIGIAWMRGRAVDRTPDEVAKYLRDFIEGTGGDWDWDDFTSVPIKDPALERIRQEAESVPLPVSSMDRLLELLREAEALRKR